ncbi:Uncharacterised protein [Klebsiella pneumoniae]|nr:Uncharacterised protein [Klebsiella pneumoniae]SWS75235.1 Uncharacterised protein [Klebsiella pneumoniae]
MDLKTTLLIKLSGLCSKLSRILKKLPTSNSAVIHSSVRATQNLKFP